MVWHHLYKVMQLSLRLHLSQNMKIRVLYVSRNQKEQTRKLCNGEGGNICSGKADLEDPAQGHSCHYKARLTCILPLTSCLPWKTFLALCAQVTLELAFGALPAVMPLIKPGAPSEQNSYIQEAAREDTASSRY